MVLSSPLLPVSLSPVGYVFFSTILVMKTFLAVDFILAILVLFSFIHDVLQILKKCVFYL